MRNNNFLLCRYNNQLYYIFREQQRSSKGTDKVKEAGDQRNAGIQYKSEWCESTGSQKVKNGDKHKCWSHKTCDHINKKYFKWRWKQPQSDCCSTDLGGWQVHQHQDMPGNLIKRCISCANKATSVHHISRLLGINWPFYEELLN